MRLLFIVVLSPLTQYRPGVLDRVEPVLVQAFVPELAVEAFDKPDQNLYLSLNAPPDQVVVMLMESDLMTSVYLPENVLGPGVQDAELEDRCQEAGFQDRLVNLSLD